jgi:c-di-GMP-binding flagellar brake protein YcgR
VKWCAYQLGGKRDEESLKKIADQISADPALKVLQTKLEVHLHSSFEFEIFLFFNVIEYH